MFKITFFKVFPLMKPCSRTLLSEENWLPGCCYIQKFNSLGWIFTAYYLFLSTDIFWQW